MENIEIRSDVYGDKGEYRYVGWMRLRNVLERHALGAIETRFIGTYLDIESERMPGDPEYPTLRIVAGSRAQVVNVVAHIKKEQLARAQDK